MRSLGSLARVISAVYLLNIGCSRPNRDISVIKDSGNVTMVPDRLSQSSIERPLALDASAQVDASMRLGESGVLEGTLTLDGTTYNAGEVMVSDSTDSITVYLSVRKIVSNVNCPPGTSVTYEKRNGEIRLRSFRLGEDGDVYGVRVHRLRGVSVNDGHVRTRELGRGERICGNNFGAYALVRYNESGRMEHIASGSESPLLLNGHNFINSERGFPVYPNGCLRFGTLAHDDTIDGHHLGGSFGVDLSVSFHSNRHMECGTLFGNQWLNGRLYQGGDETCFWPNGVVSSGRARNFRVGRDYFRDWAEVRSFQNGRVGWVRTDDGRTHTYDMRGEQIDHRPGM